MDTQKIDEIISSSTVEELSGMAQIARTTRSSMYKVEGDTAGTYSLWALIPSICPDWLWSEAKSADGWTLGFVAEALGLIGSDVRVLPNGKPYTNLSFYSSAGYRDNEVLLKWSNSAPDRVEHVKTAMESINNIIGAAREAYELERLAVFAVVFDHVYNSYKEGDIPTEPPYELDNENTSSDGEDCNY